MIIEPLLYAALFLLIFGLVWPRILAVDERKIRRLTFNISVLNIASGLIRELTKAFNNLGTKCETKK